MEGSTSGSVIPDSVMESVKRSLGDVEQVGAELPQFLALCGDPQVLAEMAPIQRAQSLLLLSNLTTTLFTVRLRCSGLYDDDHRVNTELVRLLDSPLLTTFRGLYLNVIFVYYVGEVKIVSGEATALHRFEQR